MISPLKQEAALLRDIGHPARLKILCLLMRKERECVCRMLDEVAVPQPTLSRHLAILRAQGVIEDEREGAMVFYRIIDPRIPGLLKALGLPCAVRVEGANRRNKQRHINHKGTKSTEEGKGGQRRDYPAGHPAA